MYSNQEVKHEKKVEKAVEKPLIELDGPGLRRLVAAGLGGAVRPTRVAAPSTSLPSRSRRRERELMRALQRSRISWTSTCRWRRGRSSLWGRRACRREGRAALMRS